MNQEQSRTGDAYLDMSSRLENFTHISLEVEGDLETWEVAEERPTGSRQKLTLIRLDQPAKRGARFEPLCHRLLDIYPEGRARGASGL